MLNLWPGALIPVALVAAPLRPASLIESDVSVSVGAMAQRPSVRAVLSAPGLHVNRRTGSPATVADLFGPLGVLSAATNPTATAALVYPLRTGFSSGDPGTAVDLFGPLRVAIAAMEPEDSTVLFGPLRTDVSRGTPFVSPNISSPLQTRISRLDPEVHAILRGPLRTAASSGAGTPTARLSGPLRVGASAGIPLIETGAVQLGLSVDITALDGRVSAQILPSGMQVSLLAANPDVLARLRGPLRVSSLSDEPSVLAHVLGPLRVSPSSGEPSADFAFSAVTGLFVNARAGEPYVIFGEEDEISSRYDPVRIVVKIAAEATIVKEGKHEHRTLVPKEVTRIKVEPEAVVATVPNETKTIAL